ncbi:MAG: hypothetical protein NTY74_10440 [Ignavibacteriae bacterium]|nr:hypothetical protein [Ignavibacteriota bacterium]
MIELGGLYYKLCLVDTCIISELLKFKEELGSFIVPKFLQEQRLFCYSIKNIEEMEICKDIFEEFISYTSIMPTILLKTDEMLLDEEINNYENDNYKIDPILIFVNMLKGADYYKEFKDIFTQNIISENFKRNRDLKPFVLNAMVKKSNSYPSENIFLEKRYINNWLTSEMHNILFGIYKEFVDNKIKLREPLNYDKFLSLKSMTLIRFYKFYLKHRKPKPSDVNDVYISSAFPYVDSVFLEKDMTNQILQIKNKHNFYKELEILKLSDFVS